MKVFPRFHSAACRTAKKLAREYERWQFHAVRTLLRRELARLPSRHVHIPRPTYLCRCFICEQLFLVPQADRYSRPRRFCGLRCAHRWAKLTRLHGLDYTTPREVIRGYQLLGQAHLIIQGRKDEVDKMLIPVP